MTWVTQGCACGSTLGYSPAPLRGWNPVPRSHAGPALSPSAESFHIHVVHPKSGGRASGVESNLRSANPKFSDQSTDKCFRKSAFCFSEPLGMLP
jgi:hypothetical protein